LTRIGATNEETFGLLLATTEAFTNAVSHGQPHSLWVEVEASYERALVEILIHDHGRGWHEQTGAEPELGLTLMQALVDEATLSSDHSGTYLRLKRVLHPLARARASGRR
jgi:anti-sigma regulatory factor (Ser/Thr protein kinase)